MVPTSSDHLGGGLPAVRQHAAGAVQCLVHPGLPREYPSVHRRPREGFQEQLCSQGEIRPDRLRERLREKREAELEELYTRPFEDIAVEEFLDQLPKPQIEEVVEPEPMDTSSAPKENADTPIDTSGVKAGTGDLPQDRSSRCAYGS